MAFNREILTFQLGNYSNFIGAHWWNIQESGFSYDSTSAPSDINHDVLYREGKNPQGYTTYTPRLLSVDLTGSLKHLPEHGELYLDIDQQANISNEPDSARSLLWDADKLEVINSDPIEKPQFQQDLENTAAQMTVDDYDFTNTTQTWTDYLVTRYHPRSINLIRSYAHSSTEDLFDLFTNGQRIWTDEYFEEDFSDRIRQYIEECNNCQGFQVIFDCTNGFSGLALKCLEYLGDAYSKVSLAIPVFTPKMLNFSNANQSLTETIRTVNIATTYAQLIDRCDLILPLSTMSRIWRSPATPRQFPLIKYDSENLYETGAIIATYLDTISLRYRLKSPTSSNYLSGFCTDLNNYGRKLTGAALALPFAIKSDEDFIDCLDQQSGSLYTQLSPNTSIGTNRIIQSTFIRGVPENRLKRPLKSAKEQMKMAAYKCSSVSEMLQLYFQCNNYASMAHVAALPTGMPVKRPFPQQMFDDTIGYDGFVNEFGVAEEQSVQSVPILATAQVSGDLADTLETLHREAERIKIGRLNCFKQTDFGSDEYKEILEALLDFKDIYDDISLL